MLYWYMLTSNVTYRWKTGLAGSAEYEAPTLTSQITCTRCGGGGHIESDCKVDLYVVMIMKPYTTMCL